MSDEQDQQEVLDQSQGSILLSLISQLRKGSDLSKVTLPTFVLEPRSMLERITDFMSHPDLLLQTPAKEHPTERFIDVVRYFLSGWHIKPKGVKKPYNPVLGEMFRCKWKLPNGTESFYVCEQVSHHPAASAYMYCNPESQILINGDIRPKSRFLGNSAATLMEGSTRVVFLNRPDEVYHITLPNMYARGILFGTMYMELADAAVIKCEKSGLSCELDFKVKGFFSGTLNSVAGKIKDDENGEVLYHISGTWSDTLFINEHPSGEKEVFFKVTEHPIIPLIVNPSNEEFESRNLWAKVTKNINERNLDQATIEKTAIEENQRKLRHQRQEKNIKWQPRFFDIDGDDFHFKYPLPKNAKEAVQFLQNVLFAESPLPEHQHFWLE